MNTRRIRVLFLCTGNSARSVIAEALLKKAGGEAFEVYSAGTRPKGLNPYTAQILEKNDVPLGQFESKSMEPFVGQNFDYVITVCDQAAEECPIFPGDPERIHWSFPDPAAVEGTELEKQAAFQETFNGMQRRISLFVPVALRAAQTVSNR